MYHCNHSSFICKPENTNKTLILEHFEGLLSFYSLFVGLFEVCSWFDLC